MGEKFLWSSFDWTKSYSAAWVIICVLLGMYAKCDFQCTLACTLKDKRHEVKALKLQILFSKVFEVKNSSFSKGGHCSVVHPPPFCVRLGAGAAGNSAAPPPVRLCFIRAQSSMNAPIARRDLCAEENPELARIPVTEANGPVVKGFTHNFVRTQFWMKLVSFTNIFYDEKLRKITQAFLTGFGSEETRIVPESLWSKTEDAVACFRGSIQKKWLFHIKVYSSFFLYWNLKKCARF